MLNHRLLKPGTKVNINPDGVTTRFTAVYIGENTQGYAVCEYRGYEKGASSGNVPFVKYCTVAPCFMWKL